MEIANTTPSNAPSEGAPENSESTSQGITSKVLYGGQEMEINNFLRSQKHKTKVDGKELEVDYDELVNGYGHNSAANARMRAAAEKEKALRDRLFSIKQNPHSGFEFLEQLGIDVDSIAHERVLKKMEYELMTPEQRDYHDTKQKLESYQTREKKEQETKRAQEVEQLQQKAVTELEQGIVEYLNNSKQRVDPATVGRAVDFIISAMEHGQEMGIDEAFKRASGWFEKESKSIFQRQLDELLKSGQVPKELAAAVRKADIAAMRTESPKRVAPENPSTNKSNTGNDIDSYFTNLERKFKR